MKVTVKEEPAWRRVLDIEVPADVVSRELDKVVEEFRRRMVLPGFRKGHVPSDLVRKQMSGDLESEVLRRVLPQAFSDAVRDRALKPIGDPSLSNLRYAPGQPLSFTATIEVVPQVEVTGYQGLRLTKEEREIKDEDLNAILDQLRDQNADLEDVDRPAQGGDVVTVKYHETLEGGAPTGEESREVALTLGSPHTPPAFNEALLGAVLGDMKNIPLTYPPDHPDQELAGKTVVFHVTVMKIQEKIWPALDDTFASKVLETEGATLEDLRTRIRLRLEVDGRLAATRDLERKLINRLLELNPFEVPRGLVDATLERIIEDARRENGALPADEEERMREAYRAGVERRYRTDILIEAVGSKEGIEVTEEDLDREIASFAESEQKQPAQVKAEIKKNEGLDRLRDELFRRRVIDKLVELAEVTVVKTSPGPSQEAT
jgi:trigger factor